jgi:hypothetical protein
MAYIFFFQLDDEPKTTSRYGPSSRSYQMQMMHLQTWVLQQTEIGSLLDEEQGHLFGLVCKFVLDGGVFLIFFYTCSIYGLEREI